MRTKIILFFLWMPILAFAQVGIGTVKPTETLDVNGTLRVRSISGVGSNASAKDSIIVYDNDGVFKRVTAAQILNQANGLSSITASSPLAGNGTASNPLVLGQNGASAGQVLQWDGAKWIPASASALGTLSLNVGTTGTNVNTAGSPASLGGAITLNIPDAGNTARGVVTTGNQSFAGTKIFTAVGINTSSPAASSILDVSGGYKLGNTGTVQKNSIAFSANVNSTIGAANSAGILGGFDISGILDVNVTIPIANRPSSTQAVVSISPAFDLPGAVTISSVRLTSTSNVRIRFTNADLSNSRTISGNVYFKIDEF